MISKIYDALIKYVKESFEEYGVNIFPIYNSNISVAKNFINTISSSRDDFIDHIQNNDLEKLNNHIVLYYSYSPIKPVDYMFNNMKLEVFFKNIDMLFQKTYESSEIKEIDEGTQVFEEKYTNQLDSEYYIRDLILGKFSIDFVLVSNDIKILNDLQFLYYSKFYKNSNNIKLNIKIPEIEDELEITSCKINWSEIMDIGHIDYNYNGNLYQMTFSVEAEFPIFSNYVKTANGIKEIDFIVYLEKIK